MLLEMNPPARVLGGRAGVVVVRVSCQVQVHALARVPCLLKRKNSLCAVKFCRAPIELPVNLPVCPGLPRVLRALCVAVCTVWPCALCLVQSLGGGRVGAVSSARVTCALCAPSYARACPVRCAVLCLVLNGCGCSVFRGWHEERLNRWDHRNCALPGGWVNDACLYQAMQGQCNAGEMGIKCCAAQGLQRTMNASLFHVAGALQCGRCDIWSAAHAGRPALCCCGR